MTSETPNPAIGRIVWYTLTEADAEAVNRRRANFTAFCEGHAHPHEPGQPGATGHIGHVGNIATAGDTCPAMVVRTWYGTGAVNLQVHLDGNDTYWATSRTPGDGYGHWQWPPRTEPAYTVTMPSTMGTATAGNITVNYPGTVWESGQ